MDDELSRLRRAHERDPADVEARRRLEAARERVAPSNRPAASIRVEDLPEVGRRVDVSAPGLVGPLGERVSGSASRAEWTRRGWRGGGSVILSPTGRYASLRLDDTFAVIAPPGRPAQDDRYLAVVVLLDVATRRLLALPHGPAPVRAHRFLDDERLAVGSGEHHRKGEFTAAARIDRTLRTWRTADGRLLSETALHEVPASITLNERGEVVARGAPDEPRALAAAAHDAQGRSLEVALEWEGPRDDAFVRIVEDGASARLPLFRRAGTPPRQRPPVRTAPPFRLPPDGRARITDVALVADDASGDFALAIVRAGSTWTALLGRRRDEAWLGRVVIGGWSSRRPIGLIEAPPGRLVIDHGDEQTRVELEPPWQALRFEP